MSEVGATLQFDLVDGRNANAILTGRALAAWADALEEASRVIDPYGTVVIELVGTEAGSIKLHAIFRYLEHSVLDPAAAALRPYPRLKAFLALNVFNMPGMIVGGAVGGVLATVVISEATPEAQKAATVAAERVQASPAVKTKAQNFYGSVERDSAVTGVKIFEDGQSTPIVSIPRQDFQAISGLASIDEDNQEGRRRRDIWDVVVTHPVAIAKSVKWGFKVNGLPFRAKIKDQRFLLALRERTLPLQLHEGVAMRVAVEWFEMPVGDHWEADIRSYEVTEVLWPTPLATPMLEPGPLFGKDNDPAQNDD